MTEAARQSGQWGRLVRASWGPAAPSHETITYPVGGAPLESFDTVTLWVATRSVIGPPWASVGQSL